MDPIFLLQQHGSALAVLVVSLCYVHFQSKYNTERIEALEKEITAMKSKDQNDHDKIMDRIDGGFHSMSSMITETKRDLSGKIDNIYDRINRLERGLGRVEGAQAHRTTANED